MSRVIIITGQTATGKTKLAIDYAKKYDGELISADSRQIYKDLEVISGQDKHLFEDLGIKVWLYDELDPKERFSSHDFKERAGAIIKDVYKRGKTPIIVGGTYFYIKHLLYGIETEGVLADWDLRHSLAKASIKQLQGKLKKVAPKLYLGLNDSEKNNPQRLIRKIEITQSGSHNKLRLKKQTYDIDLKLFTGDKNIDFTYLGLRFKKKENMKIVIENRVRQRIEDGALEEVKKLLNRGYKTSDPGLRINACEEIVEFIKGNLTKDKLIERWITIEMQYARRQYAFMKHDPNITWREL